ncbi:GIPC [Acanthosepion pharaonis]|uniref:GIPC n=1 Tax=Acanthosepion pharaonis TaxID=158019 RepID=A0A812BI75_ACAPH|nr:GIPC [Sepia pharaonis]
MLKEIPKGSTFTLRLIEPLKSGFSHIGPPGSSKKSGGIGTGKQTLRLRSKGPATVESVPDAVVNIAIDKINCLLESYMGINDTELAQNIWEIGNKKDNPHDFATAVDESELEAFVDLICILCCIHEKIFYLNIQYDVKKSFNRYLPMFKGNIGTRTGRNVLEGKEIHCDSAGFDNFDDYLTDSASSSPEKSIDTVRQNAIKSFLNAEKTVQDGESPLSKLPSKKRLSFKADATSDSDSSSITSFQPRNRLISKRGMQSFPGEDEEEEKKSLERFSPLVVPFKKSPSLGNKVYLPHSHSETKYTKRISKRGMKSFPDDDIDDDLQVYEIVNSPDYLNVEPIIMEKMVEDEQQNLSPNGGKENEENLSKIQNYENTKQSHQKSYSHVSSPTIKVNTKPGEKTAKSMPPKNWYIWEDNSLTDRAKIIITPYGVHEDTVNEKHCDSISEAEVPSVVEEELSEVDVVVTDEVISIDEKSLPKSEDSSKNEVSSDVTTSTDEERQKLKRKKRVAVRKLRVSPRRQRTSLRTKSTSPKKKALPAKRSLGSMGTRSAPSEEKRKSTTSSTKNKQALPMSKKNVSLSQKKKSSSNLRKRNVSSSQENKPVETRKRKRAASSSPKNKIPAKKAKINELTTRTSNHWTRSSTLKVKKESISPAKKQKKMISQKPDKVDTSSVPKMPLQKHEKKRSSTTLVTLPRKRRTSGPLSSEDSLVICNKEKRKSGRLCEEDSLVAFSQGYSKRISAEKSKSPAKTNHVTKDPNESDNDSQEGTTDWQCQGCEGLIPVSLKACIFCGLCKQESSQGSETQMSQHRNSPSSFYRKLFKQLRGKNTKHSPQNSKKGQKALSEPVEATSKYESPALQKTSLRSMKNQSSFSLKSNYTFNSYTDIKVDHKISYCVCSQSDTAVIGMMKLQRGGYRNPNQSLKEMFFTVLEGQVRVQIDSEKQQLSIHDTFVVAKNGEYSIENTSAKTACLIFTIIK